MRITWSHHNVGVLRVTLSVLDFTGASHVLGIKYNQVLGAAYRFGFAQVEPPSACETTLKLLLSRLRVNNATPYLTRADGSAFGEPYFAPGSDDAAAIARCLAAWPTESGRPKPDLAPVSSETEVVKPRYGLWTLAANQATLVAVIDRFGQSGAAHFLGLSRNQVIGACHRFRIPSKPIPHASVDTIAALAAELRASGKQTYIVDSAGSLLGCPAFGPGCADDVAAATIVMDRWPSAKIISRNEKAVAGKEQAKAALRAPKLQPEPAPKPKLAAAIPTPPPSAAPALKPAVAAQAPKPAPVAKTPKPVREPKPKEATPAPVAKKAVLPIQTALLPKVPAFQVVDEPWKSPFFDFGEDREAFDRLRKQHPHAVHFLKVPFGRCRTPLWDFTLKADRSEGSYAIDGEEQHRYVCGAPQTDMDAMNSMCEECKRRARVAAKRPRNNGPVQAGHDYSVLRKAGSEHRAGGRRPETAGE